MVVRGMKWKIYAGGEVSANTMPTARKQQGTVIEVIRNITEYYA